MTNHPADGLERLLEFLRSSRGFDFTGYKRATLERRIAKRMRTVRASTYDGYIKYLEAHAQEFPRLLDALLIKMTAFFRDPAAWDRVAKAVLPKLLADKSPGSPIRVWSAGCAGGSETYTLAMVFAETLGRRHYLERLMIYGTDIDEEALERARRARYTTEQVGDIPAHLLAKYFQAEGDSYVFDKELRRAIVFGRQDIIHDPPIRQIDFLSCRNTLMYFNSETQTKAILSLYSALAERGVLFLGKAEMLLKHANIFDPIDPKRRLFRKMRPESPRARAPTAPAPAYRPIRPPEGGDSPVRESAFEAAPIALLVVDRGGTLALANERARAMFAIGPDDLGRRLSDLEVAHRPLHLEALIEQVYRERRWITVKDVPRSTAGGEAFFDVQVFPLYDPGGAAIGVEVSFLDVTSHRSPPGPSRPGPGAPGGPADSGPLSAASDELEAMQREQRELMSTVDRLETSNRELLTRNEELQSSKQEAETRAEDLRRRGDALVRENALSSSILGSLRHAVVVVDSDFVISAWNRRAEILLGVGSDEAVGKSFLKLDIGLPIEFLKGTIRSCLAGESDYLELVLQATGRRGRAIRCKVTCLKHVRPDTRRGAILLMEDESIR